MAHPRPDMQEQLSALIQSDYDYTLPERGDICEAVVRLLPDPWPVVVGDLEVDRVVEGHVTNVVDFGAFVDVGVGVEGLVHVSEMPNGEATCARLGRKAPVRVRVLNIDAARRRLALSLRGVPDVPFGCQEDAFTDRVT